MVRNSDHSGLDSAPARNLDSFVSHRINWLTPGERETIIRSSKWVKGKRNWVDALHAISTHIKIARPSEDGDAEVVCWISYQTICDFSHMGERAAKQAVRELREAGLLFVRQGSDRKFGHLVKKTYKGLPPNEYEINWNLLLENPSTTRLSDVEEHEERLKISSDAVITITPVSEEGRHESNRVSRPKDEEPCSSLLEHSAGSPNKSENIFSQDKSCLNICDSLNLLAGMGVMELGQKIIKSSSLSKSQKKILIVLIPSLLGLADPPNKKMITRRTRLGSVTVANNLFLLCHRRILSYRGRDWRRHPIYTLNTLDF